MKITAIVHDLSPLEQKLSVKFDNPDLLIQALTHRSYLNEKSGPVTGHNERLEFLGDAVLELIVTEELYRRFPDKPEGELTSYRAALVNAKMLSDVSMDLGLNEFLLLSRGEAKDTGRARQYILANTFESVTGALYLDQGYEAAKRFIHAVLIERIKDVLEQKLYKDPKSLFQEEAQERVGVTPSYEVMSEWGPDHDKHFVIGAYLKSELVAEGEGSSKQEGQENAARNGLNKKGWL